MKIISIQPEPVVDNIWGIKGGGIEFGTQLPYPFHIIAETGDVDDQEFWNGDPYRVIGFQDDAEVQRVNLYWEDAAKAPDSIVGRFPVMVTKNGGMYTYAVKIESVQVQEVSGR